MQSTDANLSARQNLSGLDEHKVDRVCAILLGILGAPQNSHEAQCLEALREQRYHDCKQIALRNPLSDYLRALSCVASAYRSPSVSDSIIAYAARHTRDAALARTGLDREPSINAEFERIFAE